MSLLSRGEFFLLYRQIAGDTRELSRWVQYTALPYSNVFIPSFRVLGEECIKCLMQDRYVQCA